MTADNLMKVETRKICAFCFVNEVGKTHCIYGGTGPEHTLREGAKVMSALYNGWSLFMEFFETSTIL